MNHGTGIRARIELGFERWGHQVFRHAGLTVALMGVLTVALGSQVAHLWLDTSTEGLLREDDPTRVAYEAFRDQFGQDGLMVMGIRAPDVFDPAFLARLRDFHADLETEVPHLDEVTSLVNARRTHAEGDELIVGELMEDWPETPADLARLREEVLANPLYRNLLITADGHFTTVVVRLETYSEEGAAADALEGFEDLESPTGEAPGSLAFLGGAETEASVIAIEKVIARYRADDFPIFLAGEPVLMVELQENMSTDISLFLGLSLGAIALLLWILFRRLAGVILPLGVVSLALLGTLGTMTLCGIPLRVGTEILPSFVLAVGVGAAVHLLAIFFRGLGRGLDREDALAHALGHSGLAILMTGLTTAGGLLSFVTAELAPIAEFGVFGAFGVMMTLLYSLVLLPALLRFTPLRESGSASARGAPGLVDRVLLAFGRVAIDHPWGVLGASAGLIVLAAVGVTRLRTAHDPMSWFPEGFPLRTATKVIDRELHGSMTVEMLIRAPADGGLREPELLERIDRLEADAEQMEFEGERVGKAVSITDIVKEIHQALNQGRPAAHTIPRDHRLLAQELLLFENAGSDDLEDFVDPAYRLARVSLRVPWMNAGRYPPFIDRVQEHFAQALGERAAVEVTGVIAIMTRTMSAVVGSLIRSYGIALAVITPLMIFLIGSLRGGLLSMVPNLFPILLTLGLMGWLDIPIDIFTLLIGSIALGLAVDDTIHFMHNFQRYFTTSGNAPWAVQEALQTTGRALLFTSLVLTTGFFIFMLSSMQNLFYFGFLTGLCILLAFLANVLLAPALMVLVRGRRPALAGRPVLSQGASR